MSQPQLTNADPQVPEVHQCIQLRRLSDLLRQIEFLEIQIQAINQASRPHHLRNVGLLLSGLHRQLDELEYQLRVRARGEGEDDHSTVKELRRRLASLLAQRQYEGHDRRQ